MLEKIDENASLISLISLIFKYSTLFLQFIKFMETYSYLQVIYKDLERNYSQVVICNNNFY